MGESDTTARKDLLGSIPVKFKVLMGFGVILVIMAIMSGMGFFKFVATNHAVDLYAENVEEAAMANEIELLFLRIRLHAREYVTTGNEEDAEVTEKLAEEMSELLPKALALYTAPDRKEKAVAIQDAFKIYITDFGRAKMLEREFLGLVKDVLEPTGDTIMDDLRILRDQAVEEGNSDAKTYIEAALLHTSQMRLHANMAFARHDPTFAELAMADYVQLSSALDAIGKAARTDEERQLHEEVAALAFKYEQAFEKAEKDEVAIQGLIHHEMQDKATTIGTDTAWLLQQATQSEDQVREETVAGIQSAETSMLITSLVGIAVGLGLGWLIGGGLAKPIVSMTGAMGDLAGGDLGVDIPAQGRGDEIGAMAKAVQVFKDTAIRTKEMEAEQKEQERRTAEERKELLNAMAADFESSVGGVVSTVSSAATEMEASASALSDTANRTSQQASTVAAAAEEASTNVQTVASAAEELSSSISEISRQVAQSTQIAGSAVVEVDSANAKVQGLADAANKIGEVVALITDIADQTNLLALNATIEAARAGEAGKGFAVVASEVKNLANATAKATEEISTQIGDIQGATQEAVAAIGSIGGTINQMNEIASAIAAAVEEQGAATQEIARNVEQAAAGTGEVSSNILGVTQAASETGENTSQMLDAAKELSQQSDVLGNQVGKFLLQVRQG